MTLPVCHTCGDPAVWSVLPVVADRHSEARSFCGPCAMTHCSKPVTHSPVKELRVVHAGYDGRGFCFADGLTRCAYFVGLAAAHGRELGGSATAALNRIDAGKGTPDDVAFLAGPLALLGYYLDGTLALAEYARRRQGPA